MFKIYVSAYPGSGVKGAIIGVDVPLSSGVLSAARVTVYAGGYDTSQLDLSSMGALVRMTLSVTSEGKTSTVYADNVPRDGELHVLGVSPGLF